LPELSGPAIPDAMDAVTGADADQASAAVLTLAIGGFVLVLPLTFLQSRFFCCKVELDQGSPMENIV
jgi:hypothetical protein